MTVLDAPTAPLPRHHLTTATVPPPFPRPAGTTSHGCDARPWCGARHPGSGLVCTLDAGHAPEDHVAQGETLQELARWSSTGGP